MRARQIFTAGVLVSMLIVATAVGAMAAPAGPPDYGVVEPTGIADKGCPWPDEANDDPVHADAQKCLPTSIPWSANEHDGVTQYGVRIITDDLIGVGDMAGATGQITFRCQSRVGLQYKVTAQELDPKATYTVKATQLFAPEPLNEVLGTFTTDTRGNGILNGTLHLPKGGYAFGITVADEDGNTVLVLDPVDPVVGLAILPIP